MTSEVLREVAAALRSGASSSIPVQSALAEVADRLDARADALDVPEIVTSPPVVINSVVPSKPVLKVNEPEPND